MLTPRSHSAMHAPRLPLLRATDLTLAFDGHRVFSGLGFALRPGLTLVRGGDGRGKTSLLRMLAGERQPDAGVIERAHGPAFLAAPRGTGEDEALTLRAWLQAQRAAHADWQEPACADLVDAFGLAEHLDKSLFMLSTGTRRKGLLAAAFASGADLTLLDTPAAALDTRSCALLWALLEEAAGHPRRAFVLADHALPRALEGCTLAGLVDLDQASG